MIFRDRILHFISVVSIFAAAALFVHAYLQTPDSPYVPLGGDTVEPAKVKAGGAISVLRHFEITREGPLYVSRSMVRGPCPANCEIIDLPSGYLEVDLGRHSRIRTHIIPSTVLPGQWVLKFSIHYEDRFGRAIAFPLPPLTIEVIP